MYKKSFNICAYNKMFLIKTKMLVFDMAGTTVNENGIVYKTLYETLKNYGLDVTKREIENWHGANKYEVIEHFLYKSLQRTIDNSRINYKNFETEKQNLSALFDQNLKEQYFEKSNISLIDDSLPILFNEIRKHDIKIALNTGYSREIQEQIIQTLHMNEFIDGYISSQDVKQGRPYPYMIYKLMEEFEIKSSKEVIKIGDTPNDILEGKNANCVTIGVLSGADDQEKLYKAHYILDSVMNLCYIK